MRRPGIVTITLLLAVLSAVPAPSAATRLDVDRKPPTSGFTDTGIPVRVGAPLPSDLAFIKGWARDDRSGIRRVAISMCPGVKYSDDSWVCSSELSPGATYFQLPAGVDCRTGTQRRDCSWRVAVPERPGRYLVFIRVWDPSVRSAASREVFEVVVL